MKTVMPQEIEVWYLIPALRKELAKIFIEKYNLSQKQTANLLGITEAAVSQYLKSKRANEIKFNKKEQVQISEAAERIVEDKESLMKNLYELCKSLRNSKVICELHKSHDNSIPKNCDVCFEK